MKMLTIGSVFLFIGSLSVALGTTIHIPADFATIQAGINAAVNSDTVLVANGTYTGDGNKNLDFTGKAIVVMSENGAENCIIDCEGSGRGFNFHSGEVLTSVLKGFTITNGYLVGDNMRGAGIYCYSSSPTIEDCIITGNTAGDCGGGMDFTSSSNAVIRNCLITDNTVGNATYRQAGGILCEVSSHITLENCEISNNSANNGGALFITDGAYPIFTNCNFNGNTAEYNGGAVYCHTGAVPTFSNCQFTANSASAYGGAIAIFDTPLYLDSCAVIGCVTASEGGGIYISNSTGSQITDCLIDGNSSGGVGAGIRIISSSVEIVHCQITYNNAGWTGGGIDSYVNSTLNITDSEISGNSGYQGGGICCQEYSPLNMDNCIVSGNTSVDAGGGILSSLGSTLHLNNCEIANNTASMYGGGIYNASYYGPYLWHCMIYGNYSSVGSGGIYSNATLPEIINCTFANNSTLYEGGAIGFDYCSAIVLKNNIFYANGEYGIYFTNPFFDAFDYNDFAYNVFGDWFFAPGGTQAPEGLGIIDTTNANGDPCDVYMNLYMDPLFIDPGANNYFLQNISTCIDAGDPNSPLDPDSTIADMGAHWFGANAVDHPSTDIQPSSCILLPCYPNPFNSSLALRFELSDASEVELKIYDISGREVWSMVNGQWSTGENRVTWNAEGMPSGIYFVRLIVGNGWSVVQKVVLIK
jgi:predicted outer membrane repeat protein